MSCLTCGVSSSGEDLGYLLEPLSQAQAARDGLLCQGRVAGEQHLLGTAAKRAAQGDFLSSALYRGEREEKERKGARKRQFFIPSCISQMYVKDISCTI